MSNYIFQKIKYLPLVTCVILLGCISLNSGKGQDAAATLVKNAWKANKNEDYQAAIGHAQKCIKFNEKEAVNMQKAMTEPVPTSRDNRNREAVTEKWALNYVGTSYYIMGKAYEKLDKPAEALKAYQHLVETLPFAHSWDSKGWYWKPAAAAENRITELEAASRKQ